MKEKKLKRKLKEIEKNMVIFNIGGDWMNVDLSERIRTRTAEKLLMKISLKSIKNALNSFYVNRIELQDELLKKSKQDWIDACLTFDKEYYNQQNCFLMHKDWQQFERMAKKYNWQDLFIEDEKGGNNAW